MGNRVVLLTGATGYVGWRLLAALEARGRRVRCLARRPDKLLGQVGPTTEVVQGDVTDATSLRVAMRGVGTAYYLVHSMGEHGDFREHERRSATTFGETARAEGVRRVVYLGGLAHGEGLSEHLASRLEVGRRLRQSGVPTTEFQASIIIGPGSLSFEMIRALVERLPVMLTPRWVSTRAQPIAIDDVIAYLLAALDRPGEGGEVFEIGGADRASYRDIMREYAHQRGLRRWMIRVPVLTPGLSSLWLKLVTPLYARVGRKLIEGVRNETTVRDDAARHAFSAVQPRSLSAAIREALETEDRQFAAARFSAVLASVSTTRRWGGYRIGSRRLDTSAVHVPVSADQAFAPIRRIGGPSGWYYADWLWHVRGWIDRVLGGPGLCRGRRDPERLTVGDVKDCWRVEALEPDRLLRLRAEMRLPGRAWLQFEVDPAEVGSVIRQTALFDPRGLAGRGYWLMLYPLHRLIFAGMLTEIARRAAASPQSSA